MVTKKVVESALDIVSSTSNYLRGKEVSLADARYAICKACELFENDRCSSKKFVKVKGEEVHGCGCNVRLKSYNSRDHHLADGTVLVGGCPLNKWANLRLEDDPLDTFDNK